MAIDDNDIYDFLHSHFPGEYPKLSRVPKPFDHPGDEPKAPLRAENITFTVDADTNFALLAGKLGDIFSRGQRIVEFHVRREVIGTELITDRWDGEEYEVNVFGEPNLIEFQATVATRDLDRKLKMHEESVSNWKNRIDARRARKESIATITRQNTNQINSARGNDVELWRLAANSLSGKLDTDFKSAIRERLLAKLEKLDAE